MNWEMLVAPAMYALPLYVGMYMTWRKSRVVEQKVEQGVQKISLEVDGRLTQLLELTRKSSRAEGIASEKAHAAFEAATSTHSILEDIKPAFAVVAAAIPTFVALAEVSKEIVDKIKGPPDPPPPGENTSLFLR